MGDKRKRGRIEWDDEETVLFVSWDDVDIRDDGVLCPICGEPMFGITEQFEDTLIYADAYICRRCGKIVLIDSLTWDGAV